ncbi:MAG TPA: RNA polymerase sigma-70 factor [Cyclobacteriaceae bacterium]|nr:RNA polymerase sigma-70 factor [Cyclobacteriaceae bacterium]
MNQFNNHTDEELLNFVQNSDKSAFEEIYNRHWHRLYNVAVKVLKSQEEAEEILQDIFLKLWIRREEIKVLNLSNYLMSSVKKKIIDSIRSKIVQQKYWNYYRQFMPQSVDETESTVVFNELTNEIQQAIQQLPKKSQQVFRLNRLEGRSVSEIADFLKLSERAIEYHLTKSLKQLRAHLKDFILALFLFLNF